jgi:hypothetical protein
MNRLADALRLAQAQLAAGKSKQQIALEIGYNRSTVSVWMRGVYIVDGRNVADAVLKTYDRRDCPHSGEPVTPDVCRKKALSPKPFGGAERRAWWQCCQTCAHQPLPEGKA